MPIPDHVRLEYQLKKKQVLERIRDYPLLQEYFHFNYLNEVDHNMNINTMQHYIGVLIQFFKFAEYKLSEDFLSKSASAAALYKCEPDLLDSFIIELPKINGFSKPEYSAPTVKNYKRVVNAFFEWALMLKYIDENKVRYSLRRRRKKDKDESKDHDYLDEKQTAALIELSYFGECNLNGTVYALPEHAKKIHKKNYFRNNAIIHLLVDLGLRINEVHNLNREDIDLNKGTIRVFRKGDETQILPLSSSLSSILKVYIDSMKKHQFFEPALFQSLYKGQYNRMTTRGLSLIVRKYLDTMDLDRINPHKLRATFANKLVRKGVDLYHLSKFMNHKSSDTGMNYYLAAEIDTLRTILNNVDDN